MNKQQRKQIEAINAALCDLRSQIETLQSDEQDKYDNMPEHQGGDKGASRGSLRRDRQLPTRSPRSSTRLSAPLSSSTQSGIPPNPAACGYQA